MPHSYANSLLHVVFSTRERRLTIPANALAELRAVIADIGVRAPAERRILVPTRR